MEVIEKAFLEFCQSNSEGVTDKQFREKHPEFSPVDLAMAINHLSIQGCVQLFKSGNTLVYRAVASDDLGISNSLEGDERIVYQCIKASDNKGIWTKDLKLKTNLHQTVITKVIKSLEGKKIIKAVKGVKNSTRKVYMLANLEPSADITGGPWFSENELDVEFIEELCKVCLKFIVGKSCSSKPGHILSPNYSGYPSLEQIHRFLMESRITSADLGPEDVEMLVERLIFDGLVEKVIWTGPRVSRIIDDDEDDELYVYRAVKNALPASCFGSVPCGHCPVFDACSNFGPIQPSSCSYFSEWLTF